MDDTLTRFVFEYAPVKGGIVQLTDVWKAVQSHADYPPALRKAVNAADKIYVTAETGFAPPTNHNYSEGGSWPTQGHGKGVSYYAAATAKVELARILR